MMGKQGNKLSEVFASRVNCFHQKLTMRQQQHTYTGCGMRYRHMHVQDGLKVEHLLRERLQVSMQNKIKFYEFVQGNVIHTVACRKHIDIFRCFHNICNINICIFRILRHQGCTGFPNNGTGQYSLSDIGTIREKS